MPWTRRQVKFLLSKGSPLTPEQEAKMKQELHQNPAMGHEKKGSKALKKPRRTRSKTDHRPRSGDTHAFVYGCRA